MNISWGTRIAILYCAFVVMIISLVAATSFKKTDLVANDYYQQEVVFQQRLDAANAGAALGDSLRLKMTEQKVILTFPQAFAEKNITGSIHFYAPAGSAADRTVPLQLTTGIFSIERNRLAKARYEIQVSYAVSGKNYYQSLSLNLQ